MQNKTERRLCFESELASIILKYPKYFTHSVAKISTAIVSLLTHPENADFLAKHRILSDEVIKQLYSDTHFGVISSSINNCPTQESFLRSLVDILAGDQSQLPKILHIHHIFMQNLFDKLPHKSDRNELIGLKDKLVNQIFRSGLFNGARLKLDETAGELTTKIGISGEQRCPGNSADTTELHKNVLGMFAPNPNSTWGTIVKDKGLPFVAGPSGHTGSAILLAILVGDLKHEELQRYLCATMGMLVGGGYHTADEVMAVANTTGVRYEHGMYHVFIPEDFLCSEPMQELSKQYPDLLPAKAIRCQINPYDHIQSLVFETVHGYVLGFSNVLHDYCVQHGVSEKVASSLKYTLYLGSVFSMKFTENYLLGGMNSCIAAMCTTAFETANFALVSAALKGSSALLTKASSYLDSRQWNRVGYGLRVVNNLVPLGIFSWSAYSSDKSMAAMATSTLSGVAMQLVTESVGHALVNNKG
jgi:hypothetical protein